MKTYTTNVVLTRRENSLFAKFKLNAYNTFRQVLIVSFFSSTAQAAVNTYSFSTSTGVSLATGSFTNILGTFLDDDVSATTNIGFTFNYNAINYTQFSATSNGVFMFGGSAATDYNNVFSAFNGPYLLPYWDDNYTDANGNVQYLLTGVAGSRRLVIEYNLSYLGNTGAADKRFQIWLFETSNIIQFVYGAGNNFNGGFSLGILSNGTTDLNSVSTATHTCSNVTANDNNLVWPGSGRSYLFNPAGGLPVEFSSFDYTCQENSIDLKWNTVSEKDCEAFEIEASRDGYLYSTIGSLKGAGTTPNPTFYSYGLSKIFANQYIRLKQIDTDGTSTIYGPFTIPCNTEEVIIYPNPTTEQTSIICPENYGETTITICDFKGNVLSETQHDFRSSSMELINLSDYVAGIYMIKVITNKGATVHQVIKNN